MSILSRIEGPKDLKALSYGELAELSQDCRDVIVQTITKTGGHLASNLGVVELTLALHRAFDSPKDRLVWDTSNQCYTHKLVTGRRDQFPSIRTPGGPLGLRRAVRERPRHARRRPRRDGPLLRPRRLDGAPGRARTTRTSSSSSATAR